MPTAERIPRQEVRRWPSTIGPYGLISVLIMTTNFDRLAASYDSALTPLPQTYIDLVCSVCDLKPYDNVVDLGCGSGLLTFALTSTGCEITGVDSSFALISIANERDREKRIKWIVSAVETFPFEEDRLKAILSFEAFHLFSDKHDLIRRCMRGLRVGGTFGIGWCTFHWEQSLKDPIVDAFYSHGIKWGEWGYQSCDNFSDLLQDSDFVFSQLIVENLAVQETTNIARIAKYLASIDKAASLNSLQREALAKDLEWRFFQVLKRDTLSGNSIYSLAYLKKLPSPAVPGSASH